MPTEFASYTIDLPSPDANVRLMEIYDIWQQDRAGSIGPNWGSSDLLKFSPNIIPWIVILDVDPSGEHLIYRFWGTGRTSAMGKDMTGQSVDEIEPENVAKKIAAEYKQVIDTQIPVYIRSTALAEDDDPITFDTLKLPLSNNGDTLTGILAVVEGLSKRTAKYKTTSILTNIWTDSSDI